MLIFFFFSASALSALQLYNEPKFMVIGNPLYSNNLTPITPQTYGTEEVCTSVVNYYIII